MPPRLERDFQPRVIKAIQARIPDCIILKNDANYMQGIPDLIILLGPQYAMLETKRVTGSRRQPNQPYYVEKFDEWSFADFINQDNFDEVLNDLFIFFNR